MSGSDGGCAIAEARCDPCFAEWDWNLNLALDDAFYEKQLAINDCVTTGCTQANPTSPSMACCPPCPLTPWSMDSCHWVHYTIPVGQSTWHFFWNCVTRTSTWKQPRVWVPCVDGCVEWEEHPFRAPYRKQWYYYYSRISGESTWQRPSGPYIPSFEGPHAHSRLAGGLRGKARAE